MNASVWTPAELETSLSRVPRRAIALLPTPLQLAPRLAGKLGVTSLMIKRDDLTGLAFGGNKARELDYFIGAADAAGADTLVAGGGSAQSNHGRQCAAAARAAGMEVHLVLRRNTATSVMQGNLLVTKLLGAHIHWADIDPGLEDRLAVAEQMESIATNLRSQGRTPYVLTSSFEPEAGVAYVGCALELDAQLRDLGINSSVQVICTSMGATQVGLHLGARLLGLPWRVVGVTWRPLQRDLSRRLDHLLSRTAELLGVERKMELGHLETVDHGGPKYGVPAADTWDAIRLCAEAEGLLLDPVYTGKGMAGLIAALDGGMLSTDRPTVFVHTGGTPALFAYASDMSAAMGWD